MDKGGALICVFGVETAGELTLNGMQSSVEVVRVNRLKDFLTPNDVA